MKICLVVYKRGDKNSENGERYLIDMESVPRIGEQLTASKFGFCAVENVLYLLSSPNDVMILVVAREISALMELPKWFRSLIKSIGGEGALLFLDAIVRGQKAQEN